MLKDLSDMIRQCRQKFDSLPHRGDIHMDLELSRLLKGALNQVEKKSSISVKPFSIKIVNEDGLRTDLPSSLLWYGATFWELDEALSEYQKILQSLEEYLKEKKHSSADINSYLKVLPSSPVDYASDIGQDVKGYITNNLSSSEGALFEKLLEDREWWFQPHKISQRTSGKTLDRSDVFQSSFDLAARVIVANAAKLRKLVSAFTVSQELREYFASFTKSRIMYFGQQKLCDTEFPTVARNEIYYGAPGTGKSHTIEEQTAGARKVITVFHPDTQHSDFVGTLKPVMDGGNITYQFRPGPFTLALIEALTHADEHVYLIIEEINRAPAAAVFGELFQLLDRKDGASKYGIDAADPDMLAYINAELAAEGIASVDKLSIPSNLSLLATMNSSDQAVMPLDTAFKRRWSFRYIKIDFNNQNVSDQTFRLMTSQGEVNISWRDFADKVINHYLKELNVPEDRLLGPFFLSETELSGEASAKDALCGKLFVYLWDDVLRHRGRDIIFATNVRTFGELHDTFLAGKDPVFKGDVDAAVYKLGKAAGETEGPEESCEDA